MGASRIVTLTKLSWLAGGSAGAFTACATVSSITVLSLSSGTMYQAACGHFPSWYIALQSNVSLWRTFLFLMVCGLLQHVAHTLGCLLTQIILGIATTIAVSLKP
jgi:hypothetical protein